MKRSQFTSLSSIFTALLFAGAVLLSGCSDSLTGVTPDSEQDVTVQQRAQHNQISNSDDTGGTTDPDAGHNTSNED